MKAPLSLAAAALVGLMLAAAVVSYIFAFSSHRLVATLLLACGVFAVLAARQVASGIAVARNQLSPARGSSAGPRGLTVALWGVALSVLGMFLLLEV